VCCRPKQKTLSVVLPTCTTCNHLLLGFFLLAHDAFRTNLVTYYDDKLNVQNTINAHFTLTHSHQVSNTPLFISWPRHHLPATAPFSATARLNPARCCPRPEVVLLSSSGRRSTRPARAMLHVSLPCHVLPRVRWRWLVVEWLRRGGRKGGC